MTFTVASSRKIRVSDILRTVVQMMSLKEAHAIVVEEHLNNKINLSKLWEMSRITKCETLQSYPTSCVCVSTSFTCCLERAHITPVEFSKFISQVTLNPFSQA